MNDFLNERFPQLQTLISSVFIAIIHFFRSLHYPIKTFKNLKSVPSVFIFFLFTGSIFTVNFARDKIQKCEITGVCVLGNPVRDKALFLV